MEQETCKRKACSAKKPRWWHTIDGGYYCTRCAHRINESAFRTIGEEDILVLHSASNQMTLEEALTISVFDVALLHREFESFQIMRNDDPDTKERRPYRWARIPARSMPIEPPPSQELLGSQGWVPVMKYSTG